MFATKLLALLGAVSVLAAPVVETTDLAVRSDIEPRAANGNVNMAYYASWSRYGDRPVTPYGMNWQPLTHIIYAFGDINHANGAVIAHDEWADFQAPNANDPPIGNNAYGNIRELYTIKKHNRKIKTILSIGGWDASQNGGFQAATKTAASRKRFADSAVKLMADYGMDGIDIDWEYPKTSAEGQQLLQLLQAVRLSLDTYAKNLGQTYKYLLTVATPGASVNYNKMPLSKINAVVDHFQVMTYEYSGTWDTTVGHASATYLDTKNKLATKIVVNQAVTNYKKLGVTPKKIVVGMPLYGRSFAKTAGVGKAHGGAGYTSPGQDTPGTVLFKDLPRPNAKVSFQTDIVAAYSYDSAKREFVTYDNIGSARVKSQYIVSQKLGGAFFWEASGDKKGSMSLMKIASDNLGKLDTSLNQLNYPNSRFENIKKKMPGSVAPK